MSLVFYTEIGFTKSDIALYSKGLGWIVTVGFTVLGGLVAIRIGLVRAMFVSGIAMALTNLMFALLAWSGKSEVLFAAAVVMDDLTSAFATVTFVAFISMLVDRTYYRHPVRAARLARHGRTDTPRRLFRRAGGLAGGRLGNLLRDHRADGVALSGVPLGDPREAPATCWPARGCG